jgi:hypothetical protein
MKAKKTAVAKKSASKSAPMAKSSKMEGKMSPKEKFLAMINAKKKK